MFIYKSFIYQTSYNDIGNNHHNLILLYRSYRTFIFIIMKTLILYISVCISCSGFLAIIHNINEILYNHILGLWVQNRPCLIFRPHMIIKHLYKHVFAGKHTYSSKHKTHATIHNHLHTYSHSHTNLRYNL